MFLWFDKEPNIVFICSPLTQAGGGFIAKTQGPLISGAIDQSVPLHTTLVNNTAKWYIANNHNYQYAWAQLNNAGTFYFYSAITI